MTTHAENVLYGSLLDVEALDRLTVVGLDLDVIPTEGMREVVEWAVEYFHRSGRAKAPSREMITEEWGDRLEQCDITLPDDDLQIDDVTWAIDTLNSQYVLATSQRLQRDVAIDLAKATVGERTDVVALAAERWFELALTVRDRTNEIEATQGLNDSLARYQHRLTTGAVLSGLCLGIDAIDQHTRGIHDGEIAVWAAPPKGGKSWTMTWAAISEWLRGRETVLYTLENGVQMTLDRIACQICAIDYRKYQMGTCTEAEIQRLADFLAARGDELRDGLHVISPEPGRRTPAALVRHAQALGAKSLIVDQLTHVEHPQPGRKARWEQVRDLMMGFATLVSTGRRPMPLLLAHQFSREGVKRMQKTGIAEPYDLAEGAEVERSASWVFGLLRSETQTRIGQATVQILAARRMDTKAWDCAWEPWYGIQEARQEVSL